MNTDPKYIKEIIERAKNDNMRKNDFEKYINFISKQDDGEQILLEGVKWLANQKQ